MISRCIRAFSQCALTREMIDDFVRGLTADEGLEFFNAAS
jgi:hypothetical protein